MPAGVEIVQFGFAGPDDAELRGELFKRPAVQDVEREEILLGFLAHLVHRRHVGLPPRINETGPVDGEIALAAPPCEIVDKAGAPIDDGAEHIEHEGFDGYRIKR